MIARRFRDLDNELLRERGDDIDDPSRRLLLSLAGIHAHSPENLPANTVLVARRLLPSDTVFLSRSSTVNVGRGLGRGGGKGRRDGTGGGRGRGGGGGGGGGRRK